MLSQYKTVEPEALQYILDWSEVSLASIKGMVNRMYMLTTEMMRYESKRKQCDDCEWTL